MPPSNEYQEEHNGPLTTDVRSRIQTVREKLGYSWSEMGYAFDFSNTFVHGIAREMNPQRIRSKHIEKLIRDLESLEVKAGVPRVSSGPQSSISTTPSVDQFSLEDLIRAIAAKGFSVTISPTSKP